jgi:beta-lactamase class A
LHARVSSISRPARKSDPTLAERTTRSNPTFDDDPRDTSTPRAMGKLLYRIFNGEALGAEATRIIVGIMERCRTGEGRLRGRLPPGTVVAHKTGTIGGTVNDVGVLNLPEDAGRVVIAVFIKKSDAAIETRERAIAEIGGAIRDCYLSGM